MRTSISITVILLIALSLFAPTVSAQDSEGNDKAFQMNGAVGASVINGVTYQYFTLRPDISIWKFGLGLDLSFYFDAEGNLREEDWDETSDYIDKLYYIRFGHSGDPLYVRAGSLSPITLGYGLIMRRYTNSIEWPQVRRVGMQMEVNAGPIKVEGLFNNFRELETPGLIGGRISYALPIVLPIAVGATFVRDGNQYLGAADEDNDGIMDRQDQFPGKKDDEHIEWLRTVVGLELYQIERLIESGDLPDILNPPTNIADLEESVSVWGVDAGMPLLNTDIMSFWVYAQMAQIVNYGRGYTPLGAMFNFGPLHASGEYRIFEKEFMSDFFNMGYETERVVWNEDSAVYLTKEDKLIGLSAAQGFYADAGVNIFNLIDIFASYSQMGYDGEKPGKSFYSLASLNTEFVPKLSVAEAYFQQPNADKLFNYDSDGTILGYKVGFDMGSGLTLMYDNKTIYHNGEPNRITTIETVMRF